MLLTFLVTASLSFASPEYECEPSFLSLTEELQTLSKSLPEGHSKALLKSIAERISVATAEFIQNIPEQQLDRWTFLAINTILTEEAPKHSPLYPAILQITEHRSELLENLDFETLRRLFVSSPSLLMNPPARSERAHRGSIHAELSQLLSRPELVKNILELLLDAGVADRLQKAEFADVEENNALEALKITRTIAPFVLRLKTFAHSIGISLASNVDSPERFPLLAPIEYQILRTLPETTLETKWTETLLALATGHLPYEEQLHAAESIVQDPDASTSYWTGNTPIVLVEFLKDLRTLARYYFSNSSSASHEFTLAFEKNSELFLELSEMSEEALIFNRDWLLSEIFELADDSDFVTLIERFGSPAHTEMFFSFLQEEVIFDSYDVIFAPKTMEWAFRLSQTPVSTTEVSPTPQREVLLASVLEPAIQWLVVKPPAIRGEDFPWRMWVQIAAFEETLPSGVTQPLFVVFPGGQRYEILGSESASRRDRKEVQEALENTLEKIAHRSGIPVKKASEVNLSRLRLLSQRTSSMESILENHFDPYPMEAYRLFGERTTLISDKELLPLEDSHPEFQGAEVIQLFRRRE